MIKNLYEEFVQRHSMILSEAISVAKMSYPAFYALEQA